MNPLAYVREIKKTGNYVGNLVFLYDDKLRDIKRRLFLFICSIQLHII